MSTRKQAPRKRGNKSKRRRANGAGGSGPVAKAGLFVTPRPLKSRDEGYSVADVTRVRLAYTGLGTYTSTSGAVVSQVWRGNSCFDPDSTGTGGQPYLFDQWATMYQSYRVLACTIELSGTNTVTANIPTVIAVVATPISAFATETPYDMAMFPFSRQALYTGNTSVPWSMRLHVTTAEMMGVPPAAVRIDDRFNAFVSASPTRVWFFTVRTQSADQATTSVALIQTRLTYDVEFFERKQASLSLMNYCTPVLVPGTDAKSLGEKSAERLAEMRSKLCLAAENTTPPGERKEQIKSTYRFSDQCRKDRQDAEDELGSYPMSTGRESGDGEWSDLSHDIEDIPANYSGGSRAPAGVMRGQARRLIYTGPVRPAIPLMPRKEGTTQATPGPGLSGQRAVIDGQRTVSNASAVPCGVG